MGVALRGSSARTSAAMHPFFVPPKESTSTPAFHVISAGEHPSASSAFAKRAPSMWTVRPFSCATAEIFLSSLREYTSPASFTCVTLTTAGTPP